MQRNGERTRHVRGMTLIEIMVVLVILGMIAGAVSVSVFRNQTDANKRMAKLDPEAKS